MKEMKRNIGVFPLMMTGLGSIIGSGWLFGAWKAAETAGPAAIWAWILGMVAIMFIGLTYAELGSMFPESGGMVRYGHFSHGSFVGFISGWANWIAIVSVIPVEAIASIQYMSSWPWGWAKSLYDGTSLSPLGLFLAAVLVVVYFLINYWTVKLFARVNSAVTIFKILIPGLTILGLMIAGFHSENFVSAPGGFAPEGWAGVLTAIATSGVIFAFNGFQSPINMAGEAKNPGRSVPIAVVGSILLAGGIYVLLQTAYIGAVSPDMLKNGWASLNFNSPFADLALALNLNWLALLLFSDAFVSPSGTGITYTATTARMVYGMRKNGYFPKIFGDIHPKYGIPRPAMWFNLVISMAFLFVFRGWGTLAEVISVATLISYVTGPISVMAFRKGGVRNEKGLRVKGMGLIAPLAFVIASLILYWAKWPLTGEVILIMLVGLPIYFYYQAKNGWNGFSRDWKAGLWLVVYLIYMMGISYLGSESFGGINLIPYGWDMVLVAVSSLIFYTWGIRSSIVGEAASDEESLAKAG
jgi:amino acid transporter